METCRAPLMSDGGMGVGRPTGNCWPTLVQSNKLNFILNPSKRKSVHSVELKWAHHRPRSDLDTINKSLECPVKNVACTNIERITRAVSSYQVKSLGICARINIVSHDNPNLFSNPLVQ